MEIEVTGVFSDEEQEKAIAKKDNKEEKTPSKPTEASTPLSSESGKKNLILYDPEIKPQEPAPYDPLKEYNPDAPVYQKYEKDSILRVRELFCSSS